MSVKGFTFGSDPTIQKYDYEALDNKPDIEGIESDITDLKADLNKMFPVEPVNTIFFENLNYGVPSNVSFYNDRYPNNDGKITITSSNTTNSIVVSIKPNTTYYLYVPNRNRELVVETSDDFIVGETYTKLAITTPTSYNGINVLCFTTGSSANKIMVYIYNGTYDYEANKNNFIITATSWNPNIQPNIIDEYIPKKEIVVTPRETTFFNGVNYFSLDTAVLYADTFIKISGEVAYSGGTNTLVFPVEPNTHYYIFIPNANRGIVVESTNNVFLYNEFKTLLWSAGMPADGVIDFTTSETAKYVGVYFNSGTYDWDGNKNDIVLNTGRYYGNISPYIPNEYLPASIGSSLDGANILIFGDSITDTCSITVNASNETTAYVWRNPSNSYVDGGGQTIQFSMWAKILKESQLTGEIRNYALAGASYKTQTRESGYERQNLQFQIDVALNDLDNPNNVFSVANYIPDIVIFALGTNDGVPNDTYDSAMNKTVLKSDNISIDVSATISALDDTKFCESARKAFMRIKQAFPMAQIYCVLPIQRADSDMLDSNHNYLKQMAERYGCIIIDGAESVGITRDFNNRNALGTYLKDGLHPNEKGQNLMARAIISSLKSHYMPFGSGFNLPT